MFKRFEPGSLGAFFAIVFTLLTLAAPARAQVTSLSMTGDSGDYIGGGQTYFFTPTDGPFTVQISPDLSTVTVAFNTPSYSDWWYLDFAAPNAQPLAVGSYTGAARYPFQAANQAGLSVSGDGRGCNTLTGSFQVLQLTYGPGNTLASFDATFEQHCEGAVPALRGEIRYNANVVVNLSAPSHLTAIENQNVTFTVVATEAQSQHVILGTSGMPSGASFVDNGNNTGRFSWTPTSSQAGTYSIGFTGANPQGVQGLTFTQITVIPPPPANDDFSRPTVAPAIPFSVSEDATNATAAPDDPYCVGHGQTVWFAFTPASNIRLEANTFGSGYDTTLSVYTGTRGALTQLACNDDAGGTVQSRIRFDAVAGTTYYFMVSTFASLQVSPANLVFNLLQGPPPFSFAPSVSQFGTVSPTTGIATISGMVTCTQPGFITISGLLKEMHGGTPISGYFSAFVPCNGTTSWSTTTQSQLVLFHGRSALMFTPGKANVAGTASGFDPDTGEYKQVNFSVNVTMRGGN